MQHLFCKKCVIIKLKSVFVFFCESYDRFTIYKMFLTKHPKAIYGYEHFNQRYEIRKIVP